MVGLGASGVALVVGAGVAVAVAAGAEVAWAAGVLVGPGAGGLEQPQHRVRASAPMMMFDVFIAARSGTVCSVLPCPIGQVRSCPSGRGGRCGSGDRLGL